MTEIGAKSGEVASTRAGRAYEVLRSQYGVQDLWSKSLYSRDQSRILFTWSGGRPGLLIPHSNINRGDVIPLTEHFSSTGIDFQSEANSQAEVWMRFGPSDEIWELDLFSSFVESVLPELENAEDVLSLLDTKLRQWAQILSSLTVPKDHKSQVVGLWGEIAHLAHYLLNEQAEKSEVLETWRGPNANRHDFEFHDTSVEIKTTTTSTGYTATINGLGQLDYSDQKPLLLRFLRLDWAPDGLTLPALVDYVAKLLDGDGRGLFESKLSDVGYSNWPVSQLDSLRFKISESCEFAVVGDFPRIVEEFLNERVDVSRIRSVKYEVALPATSCKPFPLTLEFVEGDV